MNNPFKFNAIFAIFTVVASIINALASGPLWFSILVMSLSFINLILIFVKVHYLTKIGMM